jgi:hypothetical protein
MSKLSNLEKKQLSILFNASKRIKKELDKNSDSIHDVVFQQIEVTTSEDEKKTLQIFLDFINGSFKDLETILESSELLEDHFISK